MNLDDFERTGEYKPPGIGAYFLCEDGRHVSQCRTPNYIKEGIYRHILKPKEKPMKHKELKCIRAETIMAHKPPAADFSEYLRVFGYDSVPAEEVIKHAEAYDHPCWITWLEAHGFIEKVKEEKTYHKGQRFIGGFGNQEYMLSHVGDHRMIFINVTTGNIWDHGISVEDTDVISQDELNRLDGGGGRFKLKEEK